MITDSADGTKMHALVLVLGDLGHSPRMQNHVRELAARNYSVDFVGYLESAPPNDLQSESINFVHLFDFRFSLPWLPAVVRKMPP